MGIDIIINHIISNQNISLTTINGIPSQVIINSEIIKEQWLKFIIICIISYY